MGPFSSACTNSITKPDTRPIRILELFIDEVQSLLSASISANTNLTYSKGMLAFSQFRKSYQLPDTNPPPLDHLINLIAYMSSVKTAPSTIKTYMSGTAFHLKINNLPDTTKSFIIQKHLVGLCRKQPSVDVRRLITLELLHG